MRFHDFRCGKIPGSFFRVASLRFSGTIVCVALVSSFACAGDLMDAFVQIPLPSAQCLRIRSCFSFSSSRISLAGARGFPRARICSLNGSASSFGPSNHEDGPDEPPASKQDANQSERQNGGKERVENGERSGHEELLTTPSLLPAREVLHKFRREAQLKSIMEELKYSSSRKPPLHQPGEDLEAHEREVQVPSWAVTAITVAVAFSAGVALAQFRGGLFSRNKPAIVDSRVAPSGTASVSYPEQLLGHFRNEEASESDIKAVLADGSVGLRTAAADAFLQMQDAARSDGIWLVPLSGFRSVKLQQATFFGLKAERRQSATERAKTSAPPGYSEHHTGYALDIGDGADPTTSLREEFGEGAAYRWLQKNAARFHFELSFPKGNVQGIMYEPWHWRFVGDDHSLFTFYAQRKFRSGCPP